MPLEPRPPRSLHDLEPSPSRSPAATSVASPTAIGDRNPAYHDPAAARALGHRDLVAPPTFLITLSFATAEPLIADPDLGLDYSLVVHGEQRFELHRPVYAGDALDSEARLEAMRDAGRNELLSIVTEVSAGGERVATTTNTLVSRGTAAPRATTAPTTPRRPDVPSYAEVEVGTALPAQSFALQRADLVRYAGASGDFNVIHWNERSRRPVGLPDVIAHGMLTMATAGPGRHRLGRRSRVPSSSTACASAVPSWCPTTTRAPRSTSRASSRTSSTATASPSCSPPPSTAARSSMAARAVVRLP